MGAYGWAKVKIGGSVSKRALRKALAILEIDLDAALEPGDCEGHGLEAYLDEGHLVVEHDQASYAQFTDLEAALVTGGISFDRLSEPVAEYGECARGAQPARGKPRAAPGRGG